MKKVLLIITAVCIFVTTAYSQEDVLRPKGKTTSSWDKNSERSPWALGLEAGLTYNMQTADLDWVDENGDPTTANSIYNILESLDGISPHFGAFVDYDFNEMFGIHLKLLYNAVKISNDQDGIVDFRDNQTGVFLGTGVTNMELVASSSFFNIEPNLRINATDELYFLLGPSFQFGIGTITSQFTYTENESFVTYNPEVPDTDQSSKTEEVSEDFKENRYALNFGVGYKFNIGDNLFIAPQLIYNLGLTKYEDEELFNNNQLVSQELKTLFITNQTLNQIRFSVTLWFENL